MKKEKQLMSCFVYIDVFVKLEGNENDFSLVFLS